jgi:chemotaxis response regulator CheB
MDEDGAAALTAFDQKGGITIVQAPQSAVHPQMPQAAIHTGRVDYILAPEAIAKELEEIAETHEHRLS